MEAFTLQCERCGAPMRLSDKLHAKCPYCGNEVIFREPKSDRLTQEINRANRLRSESRFADAIREYRLIAEQNGGDAEVLWGLVLCEYGVEYVKDPRTGKLVPTCHRTVRQSILEDPDYLSALKAASFEQRGKYEALAKEIDRLQREIARRTEAAEDFDVFLSFKSTDDDGNPTQDALIARTIYDELGRRGFKVFFSDVTLSNMLFSDYEPVIFRALYSCKFFILVATKAEYVQAPWVKNEWSRFEERMEEEKLSGVACAVFDSRNVTDLPPFLRAQGVDLVRHGAGGYEVLLADAIERKLGRSRKSLEEEENAKKLDRLEENMKRLRGNMSAGDGSTVDTLLKRARQLIPEKTHESYDKAQEILSRVLETDPENGEAWWLQFLSQWWCVTGKDLIKYITKNSSAGDIISFWDQIGQNNALVRARQYADGETAEEIEEFIRWYKNTYQAELNRKRTALREKKAALNERIEKGERKSKKGKRLAIIIAIVIAMGIHVGLFLVLTLLVHVSFPENLLFSSAPMVPGYPTIIFLGWFLSGNSDDTKAREELRGLESRENDLKKYEESFRNMKI